MKRERSQAGSLLVITLWMVALLGVFAIAVARYLSVDLRVTRYRLARMQAQAMARSGVYTAMRRLAADGTHGDETYDWLGDSDWAFVRADQADAASTWQLNAAGSTFNPAGQLLSGSRALVHISDEAGRINLDQTPSQPAVAAALATLLRSEELAARVVDYMDADTNRYVMAESGIAGLEADQSTNPPYVAKNAPVMRCEELLSIPGMAAVPPDAFDNFCNLIGLQSGAQPMNINTVKPELLRALGISDYTIGAIEQFRQGTDGPDAHEQDGKFDQPGQAVVEKLSSPPVNWSVADAAVQAKEQSLLANMGVASQIFRVESTGEVPLTMGKTQSTVAAHVEARVRRKDCGQGVPEPCILSWNEW